MNKEVIGLTVNGARRQVAVEPWWSLARVLKGELGLTGVKQACEDGSCGACTVLVDGRAMNSCLVLAKEVADREIVTSEGVAPSAEALHPLQEAMVAAGAVCDQCAPGRLMSGLDLLARHPEPDLDQALAIQDGHRCSCGGAQRAARAILAAATALAPKEDA